MAEVLRVWSKDPEGVSLWADFFQYLNQNNVWQQRECRSRGEFNCPLLGQALKTSANVQKKTKLLFPLQFFILGNSYFSLKMLFMLTQVALYLFK